MYEKSNFTLKEFFYDLKDRIEYFFAKRWLDRTFGKQEYWGDYLHDLISKSKFTD